MSLKVLIRCDAGRSIGLGHLRRCNALAAGLRKIGISVGFLTRNVAFFRKWTNGQFSIFRVAGSTIAEEVSTMRRLFNRHHAALLILDHYEYEPDDIAPFHQTTGAVAYVDDIARWKTYPVDAVINHNVDAYRMPYPRGGPKLFLGTRYGLIPNEVGRLRNKKREFRNPKIFFTLGGAPEVKDVEILIAAYQIFRSKFSNAKAYFAPGINWNTKTVIPGIQWVSPKRFIQAMSACNLAVSSSGVTSYELASFGIPSILLTLVDNQAGIAREMVRKKCAVNGGWLNKTSPNKLAHQLIRLWSNPSMRRSLAHRAKSLVSIDGARNLAEDLKKEFGL